MGPGPCVPSPARAPSKHSTTQSPSKSLHSSPPPCSLGGPPCLQVLPFKPIRLQPHRQASFKDGSTPALALRLACRAFLPERMHATLYRIVTCLFPRLETMDRELQREWERGAGEQRSPGAGGAEPRLACTPLPQVRWSRRSQGGRGTPGSGPAVGAPGACDALLPPKPAPGLPSHRAPLTAPCRA